jgi:hypothetical protein
VNLLTGGVIGRDDVGGDDVVGHEVLASGAKRTREREADTLQIPPRACITTSCLVR